MPAQSPTPINFSGKLGTFVTLPDQTVLSIYTVGKKPNEWKDTSIPQRLYVRRSTDHGLTWGDPELAFEFAAEPGAVKMIDLDHAPLVTTDGTVHLYGFILKDWDNDIPYRERKIDMYHLYSRDNGHTWEGPDMIDYGHSYTGSLNAITQLSSGRIVMPFSYLSDRTSACFVSEVILSDDQGFTWRNAHADLVIDNGGGALESGSVEPVTVELPDGRVWMIIRTQTGRLYESYSTDQGETWSVPEPTPFFASNAPAGIVRLKDDRLLMCWNHSKCEPISHGVSYSRQSLVAAIRDHDGKWSGYREIVHLSQEEHENHSVCYPWLSELGDGNVLVGYLSVHLRDWMGTVDFKLVKIDPEWVGEREQLENWEDDLKGSSVTNDGVMVEQTDHDKIVRLKKEVAETNVGLTRNFPYSEQGAVTFQLLLEEQFGGCYLSVSESFLKPSDRQGGHFRLQITSDGSMHVQYMNEGPYHPLKTTKKLESHQWAELTLKWDCRQEHANVLLNGESVGVLPQLEQGRGISYVRLHMAEASGGLQIKSIKSSAVQHEG
ncbi:sialidase family protein [Paenibacillus sp. IITD108]|uniref:sialidase family protein n=1 Tax=Paenibacillus sp. IITD108 TaxID=3116649 RepID=UPI002F425901